MSSSSCSSPSEFLQALKRASDANSLLDTQKLLQTWRSSQSLRNPTVVELTTVLAHASERNRPNIVRFLLQEGAEIWSKLVADLAGKDVSTDIWDVFVEMGFNVKSIAESRSSPAEPPLKYALQSKSVSTWFLSNGADPNAVDTKGTPLLAWAAFTASVPVLSVLVSKGARLDGSRALYAAACSKRSEQTSILGFLIDQGMDVNSLELELPWTVAQHLRPTVKGTALHAAEKFGHRHLVKYLLERGADPEVRNSEGMTPAEVGDRARKSGMSKRGWARGLCSAPDPMFDRPPRPTV